jgi:hypothetical protein
MAGHRIRLGDGAATLLAGPALGAPTLMKRRSPVQESRRPPTRGPVFGNPGRGVPAELTAQMLD